MFVRMSIRHEVVEFCLQERDEQCSKSNECHAEKSLDGLGTVLHEGEEV